MLGVGRRLSVLRDHRPFVLQRSRFRRAEIEHRLDRKAIARSDLFPRPGTAVIGYLRSFVHRAADAVSGVIANDAVTEFFGMFLNRPTDVADAPVDTRSLNAAFETFFGHPDQLLQLVR